MRGEILERAARYVDECAKHAEIHTVTVEANGQHGGYDIRIEGHDGDEPYIRVYVV